MNGDVLSLIDFGKFHAFSVSKNNPLTITIKKIIMPYSFGNIFFERDFVTGIEEKPNIVTYALAGIYCMIPEIFQYIPAGEYYGMDSLIKNLLEKKIPVTKYETDEYWLDIGRIEDYTKAQEEYKLHFEEKK
jgi:NDP-sugar pyrophosphorylase family protein